MSVILPCLKLSMTSNRPKGWAKEVNYTPQPGCCCGFNKAYIYESLATIRSQPSLSRPVIPAPNGPIAHVRITPIIASTHPAYGQNGLFATKHLAPDSLILVYSGLIHAPDDLHEADHLASNYDLSLDREMNIGIDAERYGNEARFINDYRGVRGQGPNAEFRDVWIDMGDESAMKGIGVFVLSPGKGKDVARSRGVKKGEEILVSYGKGFWSHRTDGQEQSLESWSEVTLATPRTLAKPRQDKKR